MAEASLTWDAERGFRLTLTARSDIADVRMDDMPVPADGSVELGAGVALDRLEVLFKAVVEMEGQPGQIRSATVTVAGAELRLVAELEDAETGDVLPFEALCAVAMPSGVPAAGGPRPRPLDEDELDWDDDTTLERMFGAKDGKARTGGIEGLLAAIQKVGNGPEDDAPDDEDDDEPDDDDLDDDFDPDEDLHAELDRDEPPLRAVSGPDQDAADLLRMLVEREAIVVRESAAIGRLATAVARILAGRGSAERKAEQLSAFLLEQDDVEDVFLSDDDLAGVLERW